MTDGPSQAEALDFSHLVCGRVVGEGAWAGTLGLFSLSHRTLRLGSAFDNAHREACEYKVRGTGLMCPARPFVVTVGVWGWRRACSTARRGTEGGASQVRGGQEGCLPGAGTASRSYSWLLFVVSLSFSVPPPHPPRALAV